MLSIDYPITILAWSKQDLTDEEVVQHTMWLIGYFRNRENDWLHIKRGVMDDVSWNRYRSAMTGIFRHERNRNWWINYGIRAFDPDFVEVVNKIVKDTPAHNVPSQDRFRAFFESPNEYQRIQQSWG